MTRPRLLDLYSGAGGAGMGYHLALEYLLSHGHEYDAIHASPPCQAHCALTKGNRQRDGWQDAHTGQIGATRAVLDDNGVPYVLENVLGSPLRRDLMLCGEMFGLNVIRHRIFELGGWPATAPPHKKHRGRVAGMRHGEWFTGPYFAVYGLGGGKGSVLDWQDAMHIHWTADRRELAEAIPPAYTQHIGHQLAAWLREPIVTEAS